MELVYRKYTVLYTCERGYRCYRTISAPDMDTAAVTCRRITPNFKELREVIDYVGVS